MVFETYSPALSPKPVLKSTTQKVADSPSSTKGRKRARFADTKLKDPRTEDFANLDAVHPYGALPSGNRFFTQQSAGGISATDLLTDECWCHILSYCDGQHLGTIVQTCRFFYVAGHQPELWRDLVLHKKQLIHSVGRTWRDTYVKLYHHLDIPHKPIAVPGVYSDYLYRLHSCRSFAIPHSWLTSDSRSDITKVHWKDMTVESFLQDFEQPNLPAIIQGAALEWKAMKDWKNPSYCLEQTRGRSFRATSGVAPLPADFTMQAYFDYGNSSQLEEAPLYLFDRTALQPGSVMWKDYMYDLQRTCPYWDPDRDDTGHHDLFKVLGQGKRPDHTWLIVGPRRSGSVFHIDPNATHAWNATIMGRKKWIFYPPGVTPPGVHPSEDGDEVALPLSVGEWLFQFWGEHLERKRRSPPNERPLECTAMPGDVVFVPHGWWHMVVNLDEVNIAITHNYVSKSNLSNVLKFLTVKQDQISGCRDREESIKPEHLHQEFARALEKKYPELLEEAMFVKDWTCAAWQSKQQNAENESSRTHPEPADKSVMAKAKAETGGFSFSFL